MVEDEAARQSVDVKLVLTIGAQESGFGAHVNSSAAAASGAKGVMQLMPETAARYGVSDRCDVAGNIRGGVSLIKDLSARLGGNVFLIFAAYNAGESQVYAAKGVPPIWETVRYVASAANAYYDLPNALNSAHRRLHDGAKPPAADPTEPQADSVGQKWIGGSVLYVEQEK
jgi:soluble lytic murein transglycosylase-like protein